MKQSRQVEDGKEMLNLLYKKCWEDSSYLSRLQASPIETIESSLNVEPGLKKGQKIIVDDQTDLNKIYLNIPRKVNLDDFELTDEEMEVVAGGIVAATVIIAVELVAIGYFTMGLIREYQKRQ